MQAGLGGGSANAATAMFAFNALSAYPATTEDLVRWSGEIGSDISFFFSSGTAYCTGRGEIVQTLPPLPDRKTVAVHVFKPTEGLSTPLVFKALDLAATSSLSPIELLRGFQCQPPQLRLINDLEAPAFALCPLLSLLKDRLVQCEGVLGAMMSGSGTSVFALTASETSLPVDQILAAVPGTQYFRASYLNRPDDVRYWYN